MQPSISGASKPPPASASSISAWEKASFLEKWTFSVAKEMLDAGEAHPLEKEDLQTLPRHDIPIDLIENLKNKYRESKKFWFIPKLMVAMIKMMPLDVGCVVFFCMLKGAGRIALPMTLKFFLEALEHEAYPNEAFVWAGILSAVTIVQMQSHHILYFFTMRMGWNWKCACTGMIYERLFMLSSMSMKDTSTGKLVNFVSNDVALFEPFAIFACFSWESVLELAAIIYILVTLVGVAAAFAGMGACMIFIPIQIVLAGQFSKIRSNTATATDQRARYTSEIIEGISSVKCYGWENKFYELIKSLRLREKTSIENSQYYRAINLGFYYACSPIAAYVTFSVFWGMGRDLTLPIVFATLSLLRVLQMTIGVHWTVALETGSEAIAACHRIEEFLEKQTVQHGVGDELETTKPNDSSKTSSNKYEELKLKEEGGAAVEGIELVGQSDQSTMGAGGDEGAFVTIKSANFRYGDTKEAFSISDVSFSVRPGELMIVAGAVGSGKSSLLSAILGEMVLFDPSEEEASSNENKETANSTSSYSRPKQAVQKLGKVVVDRSKKIAYCSQRPWILAASVRANIAIAGAQDKPSSGDSQGGGASFKQPDNVDEVIYKRAVECCRIVDDMASWVDYDRTEIGERGISVSGGQKARISLARAVYSDADLLLLDDPLSAVDSHVGKALFFDCILAASRGFDEAVTSSSRDNSDSRRKKAVVLATHQLQYLKYADKILLLDTSGKQIFYGSYQELSRRSPEFAFLDLASTASSEEESSLQSPDSSASTANGGGQTVSKQYDPEFWRKSREDGNKLGLAKAIIQEEEKDHGEIKLALFWKYLRSGDGVSGIKALTLIVLSQILVMITEYWLRWWAADSVFHNGQQDWRYMATFSGLTAMCIFLGFYRALSWFRFSLGASSSMLEMSVWAIIHSPMAFFTANPTGRVLNRFTRDQSLVDEAMPVTMFDAIQCALFCLSGLILVCVSVPFILILLPFLIYGFIHVRQKYIKSTREIKRMDATTRSPIFADFSSTVEGLATLRAYNLKDTFIKAFHRLIYENGRCYFSYLLCARWLGYRLDSISNVVIICIAFIAAALRETADVGLIGFALVYSMALSSVFQWAVRQSVEVEVQMTAVERINNYTLLPPEPGYSASFDEYCRAEVEEKAKQLAFLKANKNYSKIVESNQSNNKSTAVGSKCTSDLYNDAAVLTFAPPVVAGIEGVGCVDLDKLTVTYRTDLDPVLTDITCRLPAGSKVGICGRTGSGKSSTLQALLRLNLIKSGDIRIDGESLLQMDLEKARSFLSIIPQDPHLFSGTIRFNLDPFDNYSDEEIWSVLRDAHIYDYCAKDPQGLSAAVEEGGRNFSVGQRQLLSLGRAMLRRSPVVLMDEVTASIDYTTDKLIQSTIRTSPALKTATIITVAHRLRTIADSDLVLVINAGKLTEVDSPFALLNRHDSEFRSLAEQSNEFEEIMSIARDKALAAGIKMG